MSSRFEMVEVTPELAEEWLKKVNIQRKLSVTSVEAYARDMAAGRWSEDATAICFNEEGDLVNGQHRLNAIIRAKVTITFLVMYDASLEAILRMDSGRPRTVADQLHIFGITNATDIGAVSRAVLMYDAFPQYVWTGNMVTMSRSEVADYALIHAPQLQAAVKSARSLRDRAPGANKTAMGSLHFIVNRGGAYLNPLDVLK